MTIIPEGIRTIGRYMGRVISFLFHRLKTDGYLVLMLIITGKVVTRGYRLIGKADYTMTTYVQFLAAVLTQLAIMYAIHAIYYQINRRFGKGRYGYEINEISSGFVTVTALSVPILVVIGIVTQIAGHFSIGHIVVATGKGAAIMNALAMAEYPLMECVDRLEEQCEAAGWYREWWGARFAPEQAAEPDEESPDDVS